MEQVLTIVSKIQSTPEQAQKLELTLEAFASACNYINFTVDPKIKNKNPIQAEVYKTVRQQFNLSANLAIGACAIGASNRKIAALKQHRVKAFQPTTSADYHARIFSYPEKHQTVSLSTIAGRALRVKLVLGDDQIGKLKEKTPTSATLSKHRDAQLYIHIQLKDQAPDPQKSEDIMGVDLGRRDIGVISRGENWSGENITKVRDRFSKVRHRLQKKGTKGAKRLLKRLSGREKRYQIWVNHNISQQIIPRAIEELTGIRDRTFTQPRNKTERRISNSWAFHQLRQFLEYKGLLKELKSLLFLLDTPVRLVINVCIPTLSKENFTARPRLSTVVILEGREMAILMVQCRIEMLGQSVSLPVTRNPLSCSLLDSIQV